MHALMLAAGFGRRLGIRTRDVTKAMIRVGEKSLVERAIEALATAGITRLTLVTGHGEGALRALLGDHAGGVDIAYVPNPLYATTNNIYSLWLARGVLTTDDTILLESDIIFEPRIMTELVQSPHENVAVVARFAPWMNGTVTLLDGDDRIVSVLPRDVLSFDDAARCWKTVNIYKLSRAFSEGIYVPFLEAYIRAFGNSRQYEQVLTAITSVNKVALHALPLTDEAWVEIDDAHDLDLAETLFAKGEAKLASLTARHGGYWRFPQIVDYAYLVNPFFPPRAMLDELGANIDLVTRYPSTGRVQSVLAGRAFACETTAIRVGNGASELLKATLASLDGPIGVPVPTFEEYLHGDVRPLGLGLAFTADEIASAAEEAEVRALVLVNPGNPSGHLLFRADVVHVLDRMAARGVRVVIDESFLDFARGEASYVDLLGRYPDLVVLKSISKSYGVPGLRLGFLATADRGLLARLDATLPVWNVSSPAELFLQLVTKYEAEYRTACRELAAERDRVFAMLSPVPGLEVFPSSANFFLVRLERETAKELAQRLLDEHGMLVKMCTGKAGMPAGEWVRLALVSPDQNDALVGAIARTGRSAT